jgi:hypothetical protein
MGGFVFHVLNRAVGRDTLFAKPGDEKVLRQAADVVSMRLLAYIATGIWYAVGEFKGSGILSELPKHKKLATVDLRRETFDARQDLA